MDYWRSIGVCLFVFLPSLSILKNASMYMGHDVCSFASWFQPAADWQQKVVHSDSVLVNIVSFDSNQPSADSSSLCVGALSVSPFKPMSYVKIPCDYPMFRAGVICKKATESISNDVTQLPPKIEPIFQSASTCSVVTGYQLCIHVFVYLQIVMMTSFSSTTNVSPC